MEGGLRSLLLLCRGGLLESSFQDLSGLLGHGWTVCMELVVEGDFDAVGFDLRRNTDS